MKRRAVFKRLAGLVGLAAAPGLLVGATQEEPPSFPTGTLTVKAGPPVVVDEFEVWTSRDNDEPPAGWTYSADSVFIRRHQKA